MKENSAMSSPLYLMTSSLSAKATTLCTYCLDIDDHR